MSMTTYRGACPECGQTLPLTEGRQLCDHVVKGAVCPGSGVVVEAIDGSGPSDGVPAAAVLVSVGLGLYLGSFLVAGLTLASNPAFSGDGGGTPWPVIGLVLQITGIIMLSCGVYSLCRIAEMALRIRLRTQPSVAQPPIPQAYPTD
ncbi:hypothetical protein [Serinicoccus sp. LYQ131]|uniref:hypothetical protein n=1 Tax=Serinicoccus sp. LYQ131 TaxID=3378797 RepID=UPI003851CE4F